MNINSLAPLSYCLLVLSLFSTFFAIHSIQYRRVTGGFAFIILMVCVAFYSAGYAMELASADLKTAMFFSHVQYIGIPFIPYAFFTLAYQYLRRQKSMHIYFTFFLLIIPIITFLLHLTNHPSYYIEPTISFTDSPHPLTILTFGKGTWYYINSIYCSMMITIATVYALIQCIRDAKYRMQIATIVTGGAFPLAGYVIYLFGLSPENIDLSPLTLGLACPFLAFSIFRFSFFDLLPIARDYILENLKDCIIVTDSSDRLIDYNAVTRKVFPCITNFLIGTDISEIIETSRSNACHLADVFSGTCTRLTLNSNEETRHYTVSNNAIKRTKNIFGGKIFIVSDVTAQVELNLKLEQLAAIDMLTGIYNRRKLLETAENEINRNKRYNRDFGLIFFDIDHFKLVNDTWGHLAGDYVLQKIASICRAMIRETDYLGRYGGEEFALFLPETAFIDCITTADKLRKAIAETEFRYNEHDFSITVSFGVAACHTDDTLEDLLQRADNALYEAKATGRNKVCF